MYREEVSRCYGSTPRLPVTRSLQAAIGRFGIPREPLEDLLDGVAMDLRKSRYRDFKELRVYCLRVASAVGLVCLPIFGCSDGRSRAYAIDLGIALQLTNILRDLKTDAARGRIYVPLDEIAGCGYSEAELLRGVRTPGYLDLMRRQAERAHRHFDSAARLLPEPDRTPSGYRLYGEDAVERVRFIKRAQALGFTLEEITGLLRLDAAGACVHRRPRRARASAQGRG